MLRSGPQEKNKKLTQEELGQRLNPPVHKGAINKWESGQVSNIRRDHIKQMAKIFGITPAEMYNGSGCLKQILTHINQEDDIEVLKIIRDFADVKIRLYEKEGNNHGESK